MKTKLFRTFFALFVLAGAAFAQSSWLDRPLRNWNTGSNVPTAPPATGDSPTASLCRNSVRNPESIADRAVTRAGWSLFGAAQIYGTTTLISAMASVDGMCRPLRFNTFVFVSNRFAGTLSPEAMDSRTDGALINSVLVDPANISAGFARYAPDDALCCPAQTSYVSYKISGNIVAAQEVETGLTCRTQEAEPVEANVVSGTVTYRQRTALPRNAVLTIKLIEIGLRTLPSKVVAEQSFNLNGKQIPISFELRFDETEVNLRNDYGIDAEITSGGKTLYRNDLPIRVLTKGNPAEVEINVVPVAGTDQTNSGILRGTLTYRERIALPADAEIRVRLVDSSAGLDNPVVVAEDIFSSNGRQVPLAFELRYNAGQINSRRKYSVEAEIFLDGNPAFRNSAANAVLTQGAPSSNIEVMLIAVTPGDTTVITGRDINISKFGTGTFSVEGRGDEFLIRGSIKVQTDGKAEVSVSPLGTGITFSGSLTYADDSTLRITVTNSGNADASGEIEVKYSGRKLNSIKSRNLVLDGQTASIDF